jgi:hypothetical protein
MIDTTKGILLQQRDRILKRLADLAVRDRKPNVVEKYRIEAEFLISELYEADEALKSRDEPQDKTKYAKYQYAIDATEALLGELGRPISEEEITKKLIKGGFSGGADGTGLRIHKSVQYFTSGSGKSQNRIQKIGGLIGLAEWDASRFKV